MRSTKNRPCEEQSNPNTMLKGDCFGKKPRKDAMMKFLEKKVLH